MITEEELKEMVDYVFRERDDYIQPFLDKTLYIYEDKEILSFKYGTITTGLEGIKSIYELGIGLGVTDINYNGVILDENGRKYILSKLFSAQK